MFNLSILHQPPPFCTLCSAEPTKNVCRRTIVLLPETNPSARGASLVLLKQRVRQLPQDQAVSINPITRYQTRDIRFIAMYLLGHVIPGKDIPVEDAPVLRISKAAGVEEVEIGGRRDGSQCGEIRRDGSRRAWFRRAGFRRDGSRRGGSWGGYCESHDFVDLSRVGKQAM